MADDKPLRFTVSKASYLLIDELRKKLKYPTIARTVGRALDLLHVVTDVLSKGGEILVRHEDGILTPLDFPTPFDKRPPPPPSKGRPQLYLVTSDE